MAIHKTQFRREMRREGAKAKNYWNLHGSSDLEISSLAYPARSRTTTTHVSTSSSPASVHNSWWLRSLSKPQGFPHPGARSYVLAQLLLPESSPGHDNEGSPLHFNPTSLSLTPLARLVFVI